MIKIFRRQRTITVHLVPLVKRQRHWWRAVWWRRLALVIVVIIVWCLAWGAYYYTKARPVIAAAKELQQLARQIPDDFSDQKFSVAKQHTEELRQELNTVNRGLNQMGGLRWWPYIGRQYQAGKNLVMVGQDSAAALSSLVDFVTHLFKPFESRGQISLATISAAEKGQLLAGMSEQQADLQQAQTAIHQAAAKLDKIPGHGLIKPLQNVITPLKEQFPLITKALDQAIPATHVIPAVLGFPDPKNYLFLLENNSELRPAGGFIGTYGVMKVSSGEIVSLKTDNSYNLDDRAKNLPPLTPPEPLQKYLKAKAWYFRDANWSPDFPSSARQALTLYQREGGQKNIDGVLAVTPTTIAALLKLVGSITVSGIEFNADNFIDTLQYHVDQGFLRAGLAENQRKDIIGPLTTELVDRLLKLPVAEWKNVFLVLSQQLSEKQMLLYMNDPGLQSILETQNWAGSIKPTTAEDYLLIVDANLASLKTDPVVKRSYEYNVSIKDQTAEAQLKIIYQHTGSFDWRTSWKITRYNTYLRVYVPNESELLSSDGAQLHERSETPGPVTVSKELGKTVFGAFKSIEPGQTSVISLRYKLPVSVAQQLRDKQYQLVWQKQAGLATPTINLKITTSDHRPTLSTGLDNQAHFSQDAVTFSGPLAQDRLIQLTYR